MLHLSLSSGRASSRSSMKALLYFITWNSLYRRKSLIKIRSHQWLTVWLLTQLDDSQDSVMSFIRNSASVYFFKSISNKAKFVKTHFLFLIVQNIVNLGIIFQNINAKWRPYLLVNFLSMTKSSWMLYPRYFNLFLSVSENKFQFKNNYNEIIIMISQFRVKMSIGTLGTWFL